jgi:hypothetical protein
MRYQAPSKLILAATAAVALSASLTLAFSKPIEVRVDGQPLISDVPPVSSAKDGVFVPLRPVSEALGAETHYEHKSGDVIVTRGDQVLHIKVGSTKAKLNGMPMTLRHAPFRVRGRVMLSLGAVERAFAVRVRFDKMTARVEVEEPGVSANDSQFEAQ